VDADGKSYTKTLKFEGSQGSVVIPISSQPVQIWVDPENKVLFSLDLNPGQDILERVLTDAPNIFHRIWAAKELAEISSIRILENSLKNEKFYGVRLSIVEFIGRLKSKQSIRILLDVLARDQHAHVIAKAAEILSSYEFCDPEIESGILESLKRKDLPYRAEGWALQTLGRYGSKHFELLKNKADDGGYLGFVCSGALRGIGNLRSQEAYDFLKKKVQYGEREESRPNAIQAFAETAYWLDGRYKKEATEILVGIMLRDPEYGVPRNLFAAVKGLKKIGTESVIGSIESAKHRVAVQDHKKLNNAIKHIKKGSHNDLIKLKKELEYLVFKVNFLEEKVSQK